MSRAFTAIREIQSALHDVSGSRAAVFVGAGFSRSAVALSAAQKQFPLWRNLTSALANDLYPSNQLDQVVEESGATSSALRLAEEYEITFGRAKLIEKVAASVPDDQFRHGDLHEDLLDLPWCDVFTTNYDRFLKRAAVSGVVCPPNQSGQRPHYEIVRTIPELVRMRSPRIVKLHGTLPDLTDLVLTEEDFRTYPIRYAPFVDLVRNAMTQNVLCLIGFSGNDPNFLAWSGWLRDHVGVHSPNIYLVSTQAVAEPQVRLLHHRRIVPISLPELFGTKFPADGLRKFFSQLSEKPGQPLARWTNPARARYVGQEDGESPLPPLNCPERELAKKWLVEAIAWRRNRFLFADGVLSNHAQTQVLAGRAFHWTGHVHDLKKAKLTSSEALFIFGELIWRRRTAFLPPLRSKDHALVAQLIGSLEASEPSDAGFEFDGQQIPTSDLRFHRMGILFDELCLAREQLDVQSFSEVETQILSCKEPSCTKCDSRLVFVRFFAG